MDKFIITWKTLSLIFINIYMRIFVHIFIGMCMSAYMCLYMWCTPSALIFSIFLLSSVTSQEIPAHNNQHVEEQGKLSQLTHWILAIYCSVLIHKDNMWTHTNADIGGGVKTGRSEEMMAFIKAWTWH